MSETTFELRKLEAKDVFLMSNILSGIGIKEIKQCFDIGNIDITNNGNNDAAVEKIGMSVMFDIAGIILTNLPACEKDIYRFLASLSGMKEKEIEVLPIDTFASIIVDVIQKEEFKDFFKVVSRLFK